MFGLRNLRDYIVDEGCKLGGGVKPSTYNPD